MGVKLRTTRFGELDLPEERVLDFPFGLIGFAGPRRFALVDHPPGGAGGGGPFRWLQSLEQPDLAFVVTDPRLFFRDYQAPVKEEDLRSIGIERLDEGVVVVILVVPQDPRGITANLLGPIVINLRGRLARQLVLDAPEYSTRHPLFPPEEREAHHYAAAGGEESSC